MYFKSSFVLICAFIGCIASTDATVGRIYGGQPAAEGQFPFQISLRKNGTHVCGGSIVSDLVIVTAAQCVVRTDIIAYPVEYFVVYAGSNDRLTGGILVNVTRIDVHRIYGNYLNDVALLLLAERLPLSEAIQTIPLTTEEVTPGTDVVISGWGSLAGTSDFPVQLQYTTLQAVSKRSCFVEIGLYFDLLLCLAHEEGWGMCDSDAGGPAVYNGTLVGIAGFAKYGCGAAKPDGFASVAYHGWWIIQTMEWMHRDYAKAHPEEVVSYS